MIYNFCFTLYITNWHYDLHTDTHVCANTHSAIKQPTNMELNLLHLSYLILTLSHCNNGTLIITSAERWGLRFHLCWLGC